MDLQRKTNERREVLYHGTSLPGITGNAITLDYTNSGVGANVLTLGTGFYMTSHLCAAMLFSHIAEQNRWLKSSTLDPLERLNAADQAALGKVYAIITSPAFILDAEATLWPDAVRMVLESAGVPEKDIVQLTAAHQVSVATLHEVLKHSPFAENSYRHIATALGYDGLRIKESRWGTWDYYPSHLGLGGDQFKECPQTVVLYNTDKIKSFVELELRGKLEVKPKNVSHDRKSTVRKRRGRSL